jgi:E3 ubiquitin-protein ligase MARCH6
MDCEFAQLAPGPSSCSSGPLSPIPFDYIFLLVALPHTVHSIRPQRTLKKFLGVYWRYSTRLLRLDRLLLNSSDGRDWTQPAKPGRVESIIWNALDIPFRLLFGSYQSAATFARVPAQDRVVLLSVKVRGSTRREGMFIPLDDRRQPKTEHDKLKMIRQDLLSRKADRNPVKDFKVVYLPEKWRTRVHVFILSLLAGGGATMGLATLGPIVLGREILKGRFGQVHDGYSFVSFTYLAL